jgi:hypothetical protein
MPLWGKKCKHRFAAIGVHFVVITSKINQAGPKIKNVEGGQVVGLFSRGKKTLNPM